MKDMITMRDKLREAADILDEFINLKELEADGVDIKDECESIIVRFMFAMIELQNLQS